MILYHHRPPHHIDLLPPLVLRVLSEPSVLDETDTQGVRSHYSTKTLVLKSLVHRRLGNFCGGEQCSRTSVSICANHVLLATFSALPRLRRSHRPSGHCAEICRAPRSRTPRADRLLVRFALSSPYCLILLVTSKVASSLLRRMGVQSPVLTVTTTKCLRPIKIRRCARTDRPRMCLILDI